MDAAEEHKDASTDLEEEISAFEAACGRILKALDAGMSASAELRDAIMEGRAERLRAAGVAMGTAADVIEKLQYERLSLVRRICRAVGHPEPRSIEEMPGAIAGAAAVIGGERPAIPVLEREKAREIARINALCQEMAEDSTEAVNFTLGLMASTRGEGSTYDGRGRVSGQDQSRTFLDRKA